MLCVQPFFKAPKRLNDLKNCRVIFCRFEMAKVLF